MKHIAVGDRCTVPDGDGDPRAATVTGIELRLDGPPTIAVEFDDGGEGETKPTVVQVEDA